MGRMVYRGGPGGGMGGIPGGDVNRAKLALQSNRPDEAARLLRKRLERKPDDHASRLLLAQALLQMQMVDEALAEARRLTRDQPKNADAFLLLAGALTQKQTSKSLEAAEEAARRAVELQPRSGRARVQLAEVLTARRNLKDARLEAEEASRLEPRLPAAHLIRAMVLLSDKDYEGAVAASESALRYDDSLFAAHFTLANALIEVRRYDEALAALNRAQALNPVMLPVSNVEGMRGRIYLKQRRFGPAYRAFLQGGRSSGRLAWLAPLTAALNMTMILGRYAPQVVFFVVLAAILFGLFLIPVAGPWIVVVLLLGLFGFSFFATVRQYQGSWLPQGASRVPALVTMVAGGAIAFGLVLWLARLITHQAGINPIILFVAVFLAVGVAAGLDYLWPRLGQLAARLGRRGGAPSAAS